MPNGVTILTPCAPIIRAIADAIVFPVISSSYAFLLSGMKKVLVPQREQGQKIQFLRYHLVCRQNRPLIRRRHAVCPVTLAMRQKILRTLLFPLPSAAHLLLRFSLPSQLWGTLCGCACSFTSASVVCFICLKSLYTMQSRLSSIIFHHLRTNVRSGGIPGF